MFRLRGWPLLADESEALTRTVPLYERFSPTDYLLRQIDRYASLNIFEERRETDQIYIETNTELFLDIQQQICVLINFIPLTLSLSLPFSRPFPRH